MPTVLSIPRTLFDKIWDAHVVADGPAGYQLIYVDRILLYEGAAPSFAMLAKRGLKIRKPTHVLAVADHFAASGPLASLSSAGREAIDQLERACREHGVAYLPPDHPDQGIVHVIGPETGFTLPGTVMICGDSHTSTNGAFGCIAFGVGATEIANGLAAQCLWQSKPRVMRINLDGKSAPWVGAKDIVLEIIRRIGASGATGYAIEFAGETVRAMSMESRMTLCNMAIEAGARFGLIAPDETTFAWLRGRRFSPGPGSWRAAMSAWRTLASDVGARFDTELAISVENIVPMVSWGTSLDDVASITAGVPNAGASRTTGDAVFQRKLHYMGLAPGTRLETLPIDRVFIGSCTNSRLEDLRIAAAVLRGQRAVVPGLVVPGSQAVRRAAEAEGLHRVFIDAGLVWAQPGCSMCCALNGDAAQPGERVASTSNRNFEGRQGPGVRTYLMSPAMAAAAAVAGRITDVRKLKAR